MKDRLFQLLDIEHGDESMVSMLLAQSVFLGVFYGAFDISAHSLFLSVFDVKVMARAYMASGFAGIILTRLYAWLYSRLIFRNFAVLNLIFVTILTFALWITLILLPSKWLIFMVFVMLGPLNILALLCFRATTGRLFTLHQGNRLPGFVDTALIIGIIISSYSIPVLLSFKFRSHNILLISAAAIFIVTIIQIIISGKFTIAKKSEEAGKILNLKVFKEDPFIRMIVIFVALSVMTAFFIQYSFMAVARETYPGEEDLARFLGLFTGSMMIVTLLLQKAVFSYILKTYGLRGCLALSPVLIAGLTGIAIIFGISMGYTPAATAGFIIFFILLALSRVLSKLLKDSVGSASVKVLFQTLDEETHHELQSGISGTLNEIAVLSSGLLLVGFGALSFIKLIHFSWILFAIIIVWIFVARRLYLEYRRTIRKSFEKVSKSGTLPAGPNGWRTLKNRVSGITLFKSSFFRLVTGDLSVIDNTESRWLLREIIDYCEIRQDLNLLPCLKKIAAKSDIDEDLRHRSAEVIDQLEETKGDPRKLKGSFPPLAGDEKLINARKALASPRLPQTTEILRLLRYNNIESRRYAICMIGKFRMRDMISEVCNCLIIPGLEKDAMNILGSFGEEAAQELYRLYLSSSGNVRISKLIIRLLSNTHTKENTDFLFARLWSNSRQVKEAAIKSLIGLEYKAAPEEKIKLDHLISEITGMITWNISAQLCLDENNDSVLLEVIKKETASWMTFLFNILSIAYDSGSVSRIRTGIESGTIESNSYALEIIDILVDDAAREKLISLIDGVSDDEKLKNLQRFFPGKVLKYDQLIEDIINRDYNLISIWVKACTLRNMKDIGRKSTEESVVALLFSPEQILQEEAARLIGRTKKEIFVSVSSRMPKDSLEIPEKIISGDLLDNEYLMEKVRFLSAIFKAIPEDELLCLAGSMQYFKDISSARIPSEQSYILWNTVSDFSEINVFTLINKSASEYRDRFIVSDDAFFYLLPLDALEDLQNLYPEESFEIYNYLESKEINVGES